MNTPTLKTAIFAAETVAHLHYFEYEILPLTDLAREMDAEIGRLRATLQKINDDFWLTPKDGRPGVPNAMRAELVAVLQKPAPPETPQSARPRKCLDDNSRLHD
jgi:hypothetical protein